jgi:F-type H+-transporting ATPase subunit gamma
MTNSKEIKKRIKSISNIKKITKAMEMVAASKMRRSVESVLKTRTYANLGWETVLNIAKSFATEKYVHPLLEKRVKPERELIILIVSNRGLCGGFNSAVINKAVSSAKKHELKTDFLVIGKKAESIYKRFNYEVIAEFSKNDLNPEIKEITAVAQLAIRDFLEKKYDKVLVAYTDFVNPTKQIPRVRQLLPVDIDSQDEYLGVLGKSEKLKTTKEFIEEKDREHLMGKKDKYQFQYEPGEKEVLDSVLPRLIEIQLFQALLESNASEHSARMTAMHQATNAANDLADELTLFYNKARQAGITSEIAEISAGAASLKN